MQVAGALAPEDVLGASSLAFLQEFADADNGGQTGGQSGVQFLIDALVGFTKKLAALRVSDDDVGASRGQQHSGGDLTGIGALFFPEQVLRSDFDPRAVRALLNGGNGGKWRADHNFIPSVAAHLRQKRLHKFHGLGGGLIHLPVGGNELFSGHG